MPTSDETRFCVWCGKELPHPIPSWCPHCHEKLKYLWYFKDSPPKKKENGE